MPELSGVELAASAREAVPDLPCCSFPGSPRTSHPTTRDSLLTKPFAPEELVAAVERRLVVPARQRAGRGPTGASPLRSGDQRLAQSGRHRLRASRATQLRHRLAQVGAHRVRCDVQRRRDVLVGASVGKELQDLDLASRQSRLDDTASPRASDSRSPRRCKAFRRQRCGPRGPARRATRPSGSPRGHRLRARGRRASDRRRPCRRAASCPVRADGVARAQPRPAIPGMRRSINATTGLSFSHSATALSPSVAVRGRRCRSARGSARRSRRSPGDRRR